MYLLVPSMEQSSEEATWSLIMFYICSFVALFLQSSIFSFSSWLSLGLPTSISPAGIYLIKVNNRNTRARCEVCSKLIIKTPERRQWRHSGVFIVNFEHISHLVLVFSIGNFEYVIAGWAISNLLKFQLFKCCHVLSWWQFV